MNQRWRRFPREKVVVTDLVTESAEEMQGVYPHTTKFAMKHAANADRGDQKMGWKRQW